MQWARGVAFDPLQSCNYKANQLSTVGDFVLSKPPTATESHSQGPACNGLAEALYRLPGTDLSTKPVEKPVQVWEKMALHRQEYGYLQRFALVPLQLLSY